MLNSLMRSKARIPEGGRAPPSLRLTRVWHTLHTDNKLRAPHADEYAHISFESTRYLTMDQSPSPDLVVPKAKGKRAMDSFLEEIKRWASGPVESIISTLT